MRITSTQIAAHNEAQHAAHQAEFQFLSEQLSRRGISAHQIVDKISDFQVAIPSWALGAGGTRFGRFSIGGEPGNLEQKLDDVGLLHALTHSAGAISLHIPWDIPSDVRAVKEQADALDLAFDAVNSNTFQDQPYQALS